MEHRPGVDAGAVRACIVLRQVPDLRGLFALHRLLGLGIAEVRERVGAEEPLVELELFGNDGASVAESLRRTLDLVEGLDHSVHECAAGERPGPANRIDGQVLRNVLASIAADAPPDCPVTPRSEADPS
ncbi:hypothetical protein MTQ01_15815 [Streptomyces sp. XM4193]|uniref:hypothetical protein n=1 Tax=Streptomyces sp. XM4193 TaxID=2929782 RepID=UPI001FFA2437|nr:hypothetical protein [Streptomyces sp. XM4193]MCK1797463.1 hypothetical protein [Streptomyces sp. XM4193]